MPLDHREVEQVIAGIAGVASASVRPSETGRARLRITLTPDGDADAVAAQVSSALRGRFGLDVDPAAIRPRPAEATANGQAAPPAPAAPPTAVEGVGTGVAAAVPPPRQVPDVDPGIPEAPVEANEPVTAAGGNGHRPDEGRPVIRDLLVTEEGLGVRARVVLDSEGRQLAGEATAAKTHKATLRAVARAALSAVESLLGDSARLELESLQVTDDGEDHSIVVSVTCVTRTGAEKLVGSAIVRGDDQTAALRASLDAINRRVALLTT